MELKPVVFEVLERDFLLKILNERRFMPVDMISPTDQQMTDAVIAKLKET